MDHCPLCSSPNFSTFQSALFFRCAECFLIFKDSKVRLNPQEEKARYQFHENSIDDQNYVQFLMPTITEIKRNIPTPARGLDYGSGPSPVLADLLVKENYEVTAYDPFFSPKDLALLKPFDFVVSTEAIEHFFNPSVEFERIFKLLKKSGHLVIRTELYKENSSVTDWYYPRDPTHVSFFSEKTMRWIAEKFQRRLEVSSPTLCVFHPQI